MTYIPPELPAALRETNIPSELPRHLWMEKHSSELPLRLWTTYIPSSSSGPLALSLAGFPFQIVGQSTTCTYNHQGDL